MMLKVYYFHQSINDPVVYLEHMKLYRSFREEVPEEEYTIDIGKAMSKRR